MAKKYNIHANKSGFKIPESYFNSIETYTLTKLKLNSYLEKSGFKIPKDYFDDFKLETPKVESSSKVIRLQKWTRWTAAAAIVALAILGAFYIDYISPRKNLQFSDLDKEMIENYLDYNLESPDEFIDYRNTSVQSLVEENINTLNDQDIMEYLNDKLEDQDIGDD